MNQNLWFALLFFLPAGLANVTPIFASQVPLLKNLNTPLDFNSSIKGKRLFGDNKTWRGVFTGVFVGVLASMLQMYMFNHNNWIRTIAYPINYSHYSVLILGALLSFGALSGDAIESMVKRQLRVKSGDSWFPFDQLDYVIGGILFSLIYIRLPLANYLWILVIWFSMHMIFSYFGYVLKLKAKPI